MCLKRWMKAYTARKRLRYHFKYYIYKRGTRRGQHLPKWHIMVVPAPNFGGGNDRGAASGQNSVVLQEAVWAIKLRSFVAEGIPAR